MDYRILGDIVFEDQQPYSTAPVTITYDDQLLEEVTNDNGEFVATVLSVDAPKNIAISAKGITLYNSSPSFDTERQANVGTLIVPGNSGEYTLYGTILYANGMTYSGAITYADGEGFRQESQVVNGILEIPLSKLVYNLTFTLMIGQQELTYDRVVSYSGYTATFEQIIIEDTVMPTSEPTESTSAPS